MEQTPVFRPGLFEGQVALITGGATGIGFGIAELFGVLGAHVVIASRKQEHLDAAAATLAKSGSRVSTTLVDVRDVDRVKAMVDEVKEKAGRVDVLVNNGAGNFYAPSATLSANARKAAAATDLNGTFVGSQAGFPLRKERPAGRVARISMT